ncbi:putative disease resistance RPP13-like protein 3 [Abeliophyllum distichum]|uniref:Disease resistance RPP13-like protein 3 n=1 Tax=Abeliophyllum distichum TaxID=126358 RepID=A0ABD1V5T0_9LAMI
MVTSQIILKKLLEDRNFSNLIEISLDKNQKFETFVGQRRLILIALAYIGKLRSQYNQVNGLIRRLEDSAVYCKMLGGSSRHRQFFELLMSLVQELRVFFTIPKQQLSKITPTPHPNEVVMVFIDFLLQILEEIMHLEQDFIVSSKGSIQILQTELGFLITFLGDAPMRQPTEVEETKNLLKDIKVVINELGSFLYSLFSTRDDKFLVNGRLDLALSDFIQKFELLKSKIKEHCIRVSKLPGSVATKSSVVSLFIVDSFLEDLEDLINHKADRIVGVKDQTIMLYEELTLLRSSLNDIVVVRHLELEELVVPTSDLAYEIEYVINSFPPVWYLTLRIPQLLEKIQLIKMAIQEKKNYSIDAGIPEEAYPRDQVPSQAKEPPIVEDVFVGFQDEKTKIAEQLIRGPLQRQFISIVGMPGLGKTTLAKKLFNDPSIVYHFDKRALCVVSQKYKKKNLLINILASTRHLNRDTIMKMEEETLAEELYKSLKGTRYLIVMDDIWDIQPRDDLEKYFPDDRTGSRILFTTRNKEVCFNSVVNELSFLSEAECWELLQRKVFQTEPCPPELLEIGKQIAIRCHGLPLSVIVIASVLANMQKNERSWKTVAQSLSSHLFDNPNNCFQILKLSYHHLSVHLKPCFLYFGLFKEDEVIPVRTLISLWVAEGFIKKEDNKSSEDAAHVYLMDLINKGLVLVAERRSNGGVKSCIIHDLLHDMCLRIAKEENFMEGIEMGISMYEKDWIISTWSYLSYPRPFGPHVHSHLGRRVLNLSLSWLSFDNISKGIEPLVHLRYLAVPHTLPSTESFHKLECLLVENEEQVEIPEIVLNMANLRHLHFRGGAHFSESCHWRATKDGSFQINNLQSISSLSIHNETDAKVLECAPNLRRLKCNFTSQCPSLRFPNQLESLNISFMSDSGSNFPLNLKKLTLRKFDFSWEKVRMIGRLPNLEVLKLQYGSIKKYLWDTKEGEFQKLKFFELNDVKIASLVLYAEWNPTSNDYPELERLVLRNCYCLLTIPSSLGYISTLQMIEVYGSAKSIAKSAMEILEEQQEMGNEELKVIISH